jgi:hypothetical protein
MLLIDLFYLIALLPLCVNDYSEKMGEGEALFMVEYLIRLNYDDYSNTTKIT